MLERFFFNKNNFNKLLNFFKLFSPFFVINIATRVVLIIFSFNNLDSISEVILSILFGFILDFLTICNIIAICSILFFVFIPRKFSSSKYGVIFFTSAFVISNIMFIFNAFAEYFFWEDFNSRFNFLAIDYLIYTQELIQNCLQAYPVYQILFLILILSLLITFLKIRNFSFYKKIKSLLTQDNYPNTIKKRFLFILPFIAISMVNKFFVNHIAIGSFVSKNNFQAEITKNGIHELFSAYFSNKLDYNLFYKTIDKDLVRKIIRKEINTKFIDNNIARQVISDKKNENYKNVIFILSESMGSEYIFHWKDDNSKKSTIVPHLKQMIKNGMFFENFYASGTRTVRGIEATTLSIPPSPGPSIVRRRNLPNLYNIGSIFKDKNYDLRFVYGGNGYFDNMGEYFSAAGFEILDSKTYTKDENKFLNAWGHCDEDGYKKILKTGDESFKKGHKFFSYFLTTSNHRPYTYPDNTIKLLPFEEKYHRKNAVKYADYALGQFLKNIKKKPWYKDTIIVYVADHCAGSGGKFDINVENYRIPFILFGKTIKPKVIKKMCGQVDILPTLMNIMGFKYVNKFFGQDILSDNFKERAFVSTFQNLGYIEKDKLLTLSPKSVMQCFKFTKQGNDPIRVNQVNIPVEMCDSIKEKAISYYQYSSDLFNNGYYFIK